MYTQQTTESAVNSKEAQIPAKYQVIRIDDTDIYLDDHGAGKGKITVTNYNFGCFSYFWGSMGKSLNDFLCGINDSYFASKLNGSSKDSVMDVPKTFAAIRKYIRKEIGLNWYEHREFQKQLREKLNQFQVSCEENPSHDFFVSTFWALFINTISYYGIYDEYERKRIEDDFKSIDEPWHFIVEKSSKEYLFLTSLHKKIKKAINKLQLKSKGNYYFKE